MTKKNFVAIAAKVSNLWDWLAQQAPSNTQFKKGFDTGFESCLGRVQIELADVCAQFNPAFDRGRFLRACRGK